MNKCTWAYGVTTVPKRKDSLLPRTLGSLALGGFDKPRLFVDGADLGYEHLRMPLTYRSPAIGTIGNWLLGMAELYIRHPTSLYYAMFQDDLVMCRNVRYYMERTRLPPRSYYNLYLHAANAALLRDRTGWHESDQLGKGALALVFTREAVWDMLTARSMVLKPASDRAHTNMDGGVIQALRDAGYKEIVHNPTLVFHTGYKSTMGNPRYKDAVGFKGEEFDALCLATK
jgi:hypothetical protein